MTRRSLRVRLWISAAVSILLAVLIAGWGLVALFERHVERRLGEELHLHLNQLAAATSLAPDGVLGLAREPLDPRFAEPFSGLYWQIDAPIGGVEQAGWRRSRSLWDTVLALPTDRLDFGEVHTHQVPGPAGQTLLVQERRLLLADGATDHPVRLAVALDRADLIAARNAFAREMQPYLALIALAFVVATAAQIQTGLAPLEAVRRGVEAIRSGQAQRLADPYPDEVMPLITEVNALLVAREQAVARARAWTADLAHGLKTPLSALTADAQRLREQGHTALAEDLELTAQVMRRRIERELIRARIRTEAHPGQASADVEVVLARLLRTLQRIPGGAGLDWHLEAPTKTVVAMRPDDLMELLGNLLENAAQWAAHQVHVVVTTGRQIRIRIGDDGPGVPAGQRPQLGKRGLRLDEGRAGTGLGLAIAQDIVEAYGGELRFGQAPIGGLEVELRLPVAERGAA
ncbi:sensor histidine kinase [Thioalkalicoccus limnaeus]|uniref:histidine kinase n=1 Tax=Thioalkalicoccus limnaeus TaxID=120681 RepID=A0ABV4BFU8_9GAMM